MGHRAEYTARSFHSRKVKLTLKQELSTGGNWQPKTFGNFWRYFWLSQLGAHLKSRDLRILLKHCNAQDSPSQQKISADIEKSSPKPKHVSGSAKRILKAESKGSECFQVI